jgi:hypothetical protein
MLPRAETATAGLFWHDCVLKEKSVERSLSEPPLASEPLDISFESDGLSVLERKFALHGDAFRIFSPPLDRQIWVLSHPDHVRHVLVDRSANFTKGIGIDRVAILLGNGLMTSEGDAWRAQRKLVQPSFHRSVVATWMPHLHAANAALATKWARAAAEGATINVTRDLAFAHKFRQLGVLIMEEVRRRPRDDREFAQLVLVPAGPGSRRRVAHPRRGRCRRDRAARGRGRPDFPVPRASTSGALVRSRALRSRTLRRRRRGAQESLRLPAVGPWRACLHRRTSGAGGDAHASRYARPPLRSGTRAPAVRRTRT